jgi:hypothetical protein
MAVKTINQEVAKNLPTIEEVEAYVKQTADELKLNIDEYDQYQNAQIFANKNQATLNAEAIRALDHYNTGTADPTPDGRVTVLEKKRTIGKYADLESLPLKDDLGTAEDEVDLIVLKSHLDSENLLDRNRLDFLEAKAVSDYDGATLKSTTLKTNTDPLSTADYVEHQLDVERERLDELEAKDEDFEDRVSTIESDALFKSGPNTAARQNVEGEVTFESEVLFEDQVEHEVDPIVPAKATVIPYDQTADKIHPMTPAQYAVSFMESFPQYPQDQAESSRDEVVNSISVSQIHDVPNQPYNSGVVGVFFDVKTRNVIGKRNYESDYAFVSKTIDFRVIDKDKEYSSKKIDYDDQGNVISTFNGYERINMEIPVITFWPNAQEITAGKWTDHEIPSAKLVQEMYEDLHTNYVRKTPSKDPAHFQYRAVYDEHSNSWSYVLDPSAVENNSLDESIYGTKHFMFHLVVPSKATMPTAPSSTEYATEAQVDFAVDGIVDGLLHQPQTVTGYWTFVNGIKASHIEDSHGHNVFRIDDAHGGPYIVYGNQSDELVLVTPTRPKIAFADTPLDFNQPVSYEEVSYKSELDQEIQDRIDDVDEEQTRAEAAEEALDEKIDAEIERAIEREEELDDKIDAEISRATAAETALGVRIDNEITRATDAEEALGERIDQEIEDRTADVDEEEERATEAEEALDAKIDQEIQDRIDDVDEEQARAEAAEEALSDRIDQEIEDRTADVDEEQARAEAAEEALSDRIDQEIQDRTDDVDEEQARAEATEEALDAKIDQEIQDRIDDVDEEQARAEAAEEDLDDRKVEKTFADETDGWVVGSLVTTVDDSTDEVSILKTEVEVRTGDKRESTTTVKVDKGLELSSTGTAEDLKILVNVDEREFTNVLHLDNNYDGYVFGQPETIKTVKAIDEHFVLTAKAEKKYSASRDKKATEYATEWQVFDVDDRAVHRRGVASETVEGEKLFENVIAVARSIASMHNSVLGPELINYTQDNLSGVINLEFGNLEFVTSFKSNQDDTDDYQFEYATGEGTSETRRPASGNLGLSDVSHLKVTTPAGTKRLAYLDEVELLSRKVTTLAKWNTDEQYPSAKAVWDRIEEVRDIVMEYQFGVQYFSSSINEVTSAQAGEKLLDARGVLWEHDGTDWVETDFEIENGNTFVVRNIVRSVIHSGEDHDQALNPSGVIVWSKSPAPGHFDVCEDDFRTPDDETISIEPGRGNLEIHPDYQKAIRGAIQTEDVKVSGNTRRQLLTAVGFEVKGIEEVEISQFSSAIDRGIDWKTPLVNNHLKESFTLRTAGGLEIISNDPLEATLDTTKLILKESIRINGNSKRWVMNAIDTSVVDAKTAQMKAFFSDVDDGAAYDATFLVKGGRNLVFEGTTNSELTIQTDIARAVLRADSDADWETGEE